MRPKLIILVEDDVNLRQSIALILQRAGYLVTATDCVSEAMDLLSSGRYQLVISDINIPETRKVLIPGILADHPELSIVILTDQKLSENEKKGKLLSAHYLIKPVAPERLLDSVGILTGTTNHNENQANHNQASGK